MPSFMVFAYLIDALFAFDIIVNFNSAYQDEKGKCIDDRCSIAKEYLSGWFTIDFFSVLPFDVILEASTNGAGKVARVARVGKLYKLVKITRLIRFLKMLKRGRVQKKISSAA